MLNLGDMTFEEWVEKYKPIKNTIANPDADDDEIMFETYGEEVEFVRKQNPLCVWTDMDAEGYNYITNGARWVNRLGYYVTEIPCTEPRGTILIYLSVPECDSCGEELTGERFYDKDGYEYCEECYNKLPEDKKENSEQE